MQESNKEMIQVDVESLEKVMAALKVLITGKFPPIGSDKKKAIDNIEESLLNHKRLTQFPPEIKQGDVVEPKVGRNTLRAGTTAYGRAVVISMSPFQIVSTDNLYTWSDIRPSDFVTVGAVRSDVLKNLIASWALKE